MRRLLAIALLALLPLQFTWAAVASHCGHDSASAGGHAGHHGHGHHADKLSDAGLAAAPAEGGGAQGEPSPGAPDPDCGHCHGSCGAMPAPPPALPGALSTAPPGATVEAMAGAQAPTRPERPQWRRLA